MKYRFQNCKKVKRIRKTIDFDGEILVMNPYDLKTCKRECTNYNNCNAKSLLAADKTALNLFR